MSNQPTPGELSAEATFDGIVLYEAACRAGSHVRSLIGSGTAGPLGLAWVPAGVGSAPPGLGPRTVELEGPGGGRLLFVPLDRLETALRVGAGRAGVDPERDPRFRSLASLRAGSSEPAVHSLFELVAWLVVAASTPVIEHPLPFAAQAELHVLLLPAAGGRLPTILSDTRETGTGTEERTLWIDLGGHQERHRFVGASFTGVSAPALALERVRVTRLQAALAGYLAELEAVLAFRRG